MEVAELCPLKACIVNVEGQVNYFDSYLINQPNIHCFLIYIVWLQSVYYPFLRLHCIYLRFKHKVEYKKIVYFKNQLLLFCLKWQWTDNICCSVGKIDICCSVCLSVQSLSSVVFPIHEWDSELCDFIRTRFEIDLDKQNYIFNNQTKINYW